MIIISIGETRFQTLLKKARLAKKKADLIEVRLDYLGSFSEKEIEQLQSEFSPLFTLRSVKEGGECPISSRERKKLLTLIIDQKPDYLDLEYKRDKALLPYLKKHSPKTKLILSYHDTRKMPLNLEKLISEMKAYKPWKVKCVGYANKTIDALEMLSYVKRYSNLIGIAMGEKGFLTRVLGPLYKQPITYCALEETTAPGQFTYSEIEKTFNYSKLNEKTKLLGIIGNPLAQSPGYKVYNQIFAHQKINAVYVNVELEKDKLDDGIDFLKELKFFGCSVTIPFKEDVLAFVTSHEQKQKGILSVNSLMFKGSSIKAKNTDGIGALKLLENKGSIKGKKVLILGAGGTAHGIGFVLKQHGAQISIMNRTNSKAKALASHLKGEYRPFSRLSYIEKEDYDILVHTTSVGNKSKTDTLVPSKILYKGKIVLDVVFGETKLLENARKKGCLTCDGKTFWRAQGIVQLQFWFDKVSPSTPELMRRYMP